MSVTCKYNGWGYQNKSAHVLY